MKNTYGIAGLACALILLTGLVACGGDSGTSADDSPNSSETTAQSSSSDDSKPSEASSSSVENDNSSSSVSLSSSSDDSLSSSSDITDLGSSSSFSVVFPEGIMEDGYYKKNCPAEQTCTYAPTEQLNPEITYGEFLDTRDYQVYKVAAIGEPFWMAQNLNYADSVTTTSLKGGSWCYELVADSCAKYGRLYTWAAAVDSVALASDSENPQTCGYGKTCDRITEEALAENPIQGVCPSGWHLPSLAEWNDLFSAVGGASSAGEVLKTASGWDSKNGTDSYGFSALPAGNSLELSDRFDNAGFGASLWSASQVVDGGSGINAYFASMSYGSEGADLTMDIKLDGLSVRCLKD